MRMIFVQQAIPVLLHLWAPPLWRLDFGIVSNYIDLYWSLCTSQLHHRIFHVYINNYEVHWHLLCQPFCTSRTAVEALTADLKDADSQGWAFLPDMFCIAKASSKAWLCCPWHWPSHSTITTMCHHLHLRHILLFTIIFTMPPRSPMASCASAPTLATLKAPWTMSILCMTSTTMTTHPHTHLPRHWRKRLPPWLSNLVTSTPITTCDASIGMTSRGC